MTLILQFLTEGIKTTYEHTWTYRGNCVKEHNNCSIFKFFKIATFYKKKLIFMHFFAATKRTIA